MPIYTRWLRISLAHLGIAGLGALSLTPTMISTASANDYESCAAGLLAVGIAPEQAARSCAEVLRPADLASCTASVYGETKVSALQALEGCIRVRRPLDMASCVVDVNQSTKSANKLEIIDNCRRSLLPVQFAQCVVGINSKITLSPTGVMNTCIDGRDHPRDLYPSFIPAPVPQTLTPAPTSAPAPQPQ